MLRIAFRWQNQHYLKIDYIRDFIIVMDAPEDIGLRQKWRDHWNTRDKIFKPEPSVANRLAVAFFWFASVSLVFTALFVYLPEVDPGMTLWQSLLLKALVWFIFAELVINWGLCSMKEMSKVTVRRIQRSLASEQLGLDEFPVISIEEMLTCPTCQVPVPPRAYHCKICSMCVLKRDHHCYFTASCIGLSNQRYFIVLNFYVAFGTLYGIILIMSYFGSTFPYSHWTQYCRYIPVVAIFQWLAGSLSLGYVFLSLQLFTCVMTFGMSFGYFLWEICIVFREQTSFEAAKNIRTYKTNSSLTTRFQQVFGPYWLVNFVLPLPTLPVGVDGIHWKTYMYKQLKSQ